MRADSFRVLLGSTAQARLNRVLAAPVVYQSPRLSPDGKRLAVTVSAKDIQVYDLQRDSVTRLTFMGQNYFPVWTPRRRTHRLRVVVSRPGKFPAVDPFGRSRRSAAIARKQERSSAVFVFTRWQAPGVLGERCGARSFDCASGFERSGASRARQTGDLPQHGPWRFPVVSEPSAPPLGRRL